MSQTVSKRDLRRQLPPGPKRLPIWGLIGTWSRPGAGPIKMMRKYGRRVTIQLPWQPPFVLLSDPDEIKEVFTLPPDVAHPGSGARILEPVLGSNSLILLDEEPHLEHRRLLLPAFHGDRMKMLVELMRDLTDRELDRWPTDQPIELHPRLQSLTLEVILRAVFGMEEGARLDQLRIVVAGILEMAEDPLSIILPTAEKYLFWMPRMRRFLKLRAESRALIYAEIHDRRAAVENGTADPEAVDVLAMMLAATHEDGSPMSDVEIHDELMTALVAGHETTASQLTWLFMHLAREPRIVDQLVAEMQAGESDRYLTATIQEILRLRPVLPNVEPRYLVKPATIGGWDYPAGVSLMVTPYMTHHDPEIYPDPFVFKPERFLGVAPGTYTWIPFGGGRRRCLGASFALQEMKVVVPEVLKRFRLEPGSSRPERTVRRSITVSPSGGGLTVLKAVPNPV
jgi:cytochrome P450